MNKKIELYKTEQKQLFKFDCNNNCNKELKKEFVWLKEVDKFALTNSIYNLDNAYQNFFREIKKGNKNQGFPKFKSKKNHYYSYKTNFSNNNIKFDFKNNKIQLPKLRWIKCKFHREFDGKILNATISKVPSGKYFISLTVKIEYKELYQNNNAIGIDLGIKDLLITSEGEVFDNNKLTFQYEKRLARLHRQLAKRKVGSNNYKKQSKKIAKLYEKIKNKRNDNLHKISSYLIKENQFIFSEDLNVKDMIKNKNLAKSIQDAGWYELTRQLEYKAKWNNKIYYKINRYYPSSQLCNVCGYQNPDTKNLTVRYWVCPECHNEHDRDKNASINILNQGLKDLELL